ncbi:MAG: monooxygenase [Salinicola sp.]|uniref:acyl-CoA dehydrogenase family protein n=1 Tax=uncultured Salinicola sp. TaxID=1193542 RepID=UPI000C92B34C|nr:acyl-CoA dehydrogenase family protein [uncultured Salinicola sp.]MAM57411.1 monooxygenase [Salinicola sp.]
MPDATATPFDAAVEEKTLDDGADHWLTVADSVAERLAETAVERDRRGGHAAEARELLRQQGLLRLSVPAWAGGVGASWSLIYHVVRRIARTDSALAHLLAFHHLQVGSVLLYGSRAQQSRLLGGTARENWFWGNTLNPLDRRTLASDRAAGGFLFHGDKGFCSGALGSDYLTASAWYEASQSLVVAAIPTGRRGITVHDDWDAMGQRQTDSGTVTFDSVVVEPEEVLIAPGAPWTPATQFRSCLAQLVLVNLYVGIAEGALEEARRYTLEQARPWLAAGVDRASEDPYTQRHFGELWVKLRCAEVLADLAGSVAQRHFAQGDAITAAGRGETAVAIAEAKVAAHQAVLDITSRLFDIAGARATQRRFGFDRFWRNARTHTLHDPVDYKIRDLGRWALNRHFPEPTAYS